MSTSAPLCTWSGHPEGAATCACCGAPMCEHCAGEAPNERWCSTCDHRYGAMPLDGRGERSPLGAVLATFGTLLAGPSTAAARVGVDGPLAAPLRFAALALALHGLGHVVITDSLYWWSIAGPLERFGASDSVGRIVMMSGMIPTIIIIALAMPFAAAVAPFTLVVASRMGGATVGLRASIRACSYACGYLALASIPVVGALAYLAPPYFVGRWLRATTKMPRAGCIAAIAIHAVLSFATLRVANAALDALLRTSLENVLTALIL